VGYAVSVVSLFVAPKQPSSYFSNLLQVVFKQAEIPRVVVNAALQTKAAKAG
jgi:hypothetical protein